MNYYMNKSKQSSNDIRLGRPKSNFYQQCHCHHLHGSRRRSQSKFAIFCESSSVRGMQKIYKSPTTFLKVLWISFVLSMTILLVVISTYLVIDFRNYHTAWHVSSELDEKTLFPAISICSHNPFSNDASELWRSHKVLTPKQFRKRLFQAEAELLNSGIDYVGVSLLDKADEYYGNVDFNSSVKLGHKREILKYCLITNDAFTTIAEGCLLEDENSFTVSQFSHYNYFNCFTIEAKSAWTGYNIKEGVDANTTIALIVLIKVNLFSEVYQTNESFIMDSLTRGEGLRIVVHEVGTYPDIDQSGINIQPGKMNEVSFQNVHWTRYNSPKRQCRDNQPPIRDLDKLYKYTFSKCLDAQLNAQLIRHCNCMSPMWPRPQIPSSSVPYCNNYSSNISQVVSKLQCALIHVFDKVKEIKSNAVGTKCWPICTFNTYETTLSITRWQPSLRKLKQMTMRYRTINKLSEKLIKWKNNKARLDDLKSKFIEELWSQMDFKYNDDNFNFKFSNITEADNHISLIHQFNYVSLVRKNFDTIKKTERLVIDIYIFISRVGGLFSICIGLTTSFFVEIIEFIYLCIKSAHQKSDQKKPIYYDQTSEIHILSPQTSDVSEVNEWNYQKNAHHLHKRLNTMDNPCHRAELSWSKIQDPFQSAK